MNATRTQTNRQGGAMSSIAKGITGVDIHARTKDGRKFRAKVPAKTLLKALGWGAAVLIGIEVAKLGVRKFKQRKSNRSGRAMPGRTSSGRSSSGRVSRAASRRSSARRGTSRRRSSSRAASR
jgi:hypothetical protein